MIGGNQGVPRRDLPADRAGTPAGSPVAAAPSGDSISHPHASGTPLPAPNNSSNFSVIGASLLASASRRQLYVDTSGLGGTPIRPGPGLGAVPAARQNKQHQNVMAMMGVRPSPDPADPVQYSTNSVAGASVQRELDLLWKALDEERHVVKMKNEVINSLERALKEEKSQKLIIEGERDALRQTVTNMRSQMQLTRGAVGGVGHGDSLSQAEQNSSIFLKRPVPMPIGFPSLSSSMHRRAAAAAAANGGDAMSGREDIEYLEAELSQATLSLQKLQRGACLVLCDAEAMSRSLLAESAALHFQTISDLLKREQRALFVLRESRSRHTDLVAEWAGETVALSGALSRNKEQASVKYFKQSCTRMEKELFVNMQDLARAANRTGEHHAQLARTVANFTEHMQNLHYQCAFELFRGESSLVRWRGALHAAQWQWPQWWEKSQALFETATLPVSDLFALSARMLLQQEMGLRAKVATSHLLRQSDRGAAAVSSDAHTPVNATTPTMTMMMMKRSRTPPAGVIHSGHGTPRAGVAGGGGYSSDSPLDPNLFADGIIHMDEQQHSELLEKIRHLEGRLAQKTRLIGLHVKRIQELESITGSSGGGGEGEYYSDHQHHHQQVNSSAASQLLASRSRTGTPPPAAQHRGDSRSGTPTPSQVNTLGAALSGIPNNNNNSRGPRSSHNNSNDNNNNNTNNSSGGVGKSLVSPVERQMLRLYEQWQEGVQNIVAAMHEDLLMAVRPWARVPRALLAQMQAMALEHGKVHSSNAEFLADGSVTLTGAATQALTEALSVHRGSSPPNNKTSKTLFIRGLSRTDMREHQEYETQAMAASLVAAPDAAFDAAQQTSATKAISGSRQALLNHFYNYVSMTLLDEAREFSIQLLRQHDDLVSAFHRLRPVIRSIDVIKVSLMEGALSLAEAQRDQALTSSHWIHTQAEQAVMTLRKLVSRADEVAMETKTISVEDAANQARVQAAARRLQEVGAVDSNTSFASNSPAMQEVVQAFDNIQSQNMALNDPELIENQRLAEEFATKCNLLVNRASFLYRRLMERERDVDVISRRLAEVEVRDEETRDSTDASIVVQLLEREIADDALVMLREAMLIERNTAQASIRTLLDECQERNFAIRDLQRQLAAALKSCRYMHGIAQHAEYSWQCMHEQYLEMGRKLLRTQRAQLLPPISEVALQMFVSHFEYLDSLLRSHANFLEQAQKVETHVDELVQRRKVYEREMLQMGQEMFRLNQETRLARQSVTTLEQWAFGFVTESCAFIQGVNGSAFQLVTKDLADAYRQIDRMKALLPKNYVDVSERLELERFERSAFEERAKALEGKLTKVTSSQLEAMHDLNETRDICAKLDRLRNELEGNNRELELLLLQEREAAEQLRTHNMHVTEELSAVRNELASVKRALMTEAEAHNATIRNLSVSNRRTM